MAIFSDTISPRLFAVPAGCDFSRTFLSGLQTRLGKHPPEAMAGVRVFTNTRRAQRRWQAILQEQGARFLPDIKVFSDVSGMAELEHVSRENFSRLGFQLYLMRAVRQLLESEKALAPPSAAFSLSGSLLDLLDEMNGEGLALEKLRSLEVSEHSQHWQTSLMFLNLLDETQLAQGVFGPEAAQRWAVRSLADNWSRTPPRGPVIVAGSTGSRETTAMLVELVLSLPQGAVVLPGFDFDLPRETWDRLCADPAQSADVLDDHPQFGFGQLCRRVGIAPWEVSCWHGDPPRSARSSFISLSLRPAPLTDQWLSEGPEHLDDLPEATSGISLLEAPNERIEATSIALALREGVEDGKRVALITPDANLSRRVSAELARWRIIPDESAGVPLQFTPPAILLDLILQLGGSIPQTVTLAAVLKHPLCAAGWDRGRHLELTRRLDAEILRDLGPIVVWDKLEEWAIDIEGASTWIGWLKDTTSSAGAPGRHPLSTFSASHIGTGRKFVAGPNGEDDTALWDKQAGEAVAKILDMLCHEDSAAGPVTLSEYTDIYRNLIRSETVRREGFVPNDKVSIWGQLEARVEGADLVILGGLNETLWPKLPAPDPWLSRDMRRRLGLQSPERRIGLSAHDYQQAVLNNKVILSRSLKQDNTPTVASRWLKRFENLTLGLGAPGKTALDEMRARGARLVSLASAMEMRTPVEAAPRPCPAPPISARPERISVTQIERLIRDPYEIYAKSVLRLRPLNPLGRRADMRDRGTVLHAVLERFTKETMHALEDDAAAIMTTIAEDVTSSRVPWTAERRLWLGKFMRIVPDFIARERVRRQLGSPALLEKRGSVRLEGLPREITLTGQVDRIDIREGGTIAIFDYKSSLPTDKQAAHFSKQLELEANMARRGGFEGLGEVATEHLELIGLSKPGQFLVRDADPEVIAQIWQELLKIMKYFEAPEHGYAARLRPPPLAQWGDFDHLARRGEWKDNAEFAAEVLS